MSIYKFRVSFEEDENIFRDIEIKPSHTMRDLNEIITFAFALPEKSLRRMFQSNDNWHKQNEIELSPKPIKKDKQILMAMLIHFIEDPHQRFLYEFETAKQSFSLLIELISINTIEKEGEKYPKVLKSVGPSPVKKEDLMAHLSKKDSVAEEEQFGVDAEEDDLESMGHEGEDAPEEGIEEAPDESPDDIEGDLNFEEAEEDFKE